MHDLVHDLARSVMADEFNLAGANCRYAWLTDFTKPLKSSMISPKKLRALYIVDDDPRPAQLHHDAYSPAKYARVLFVSTFGMNELPDSIGQFKQLRFLAAGNIQNGTNLRCISMLRKLKFLDLSFSKGLSGLLESIGEIEGLMYLGLLGCSDLKELPHSFAKLKELIYLNLSLNPYIIGIPEALTDLTKLQYLGLSKCQNLRGLQEVIGNLTELRYLNLSRCMQHIFDRSSTDQAESFIDRICTLPNMEHLDLSYNDHPLISIPESASCLRKLVLDGCRQVSRLPECVAKMDRQRLFGLSFPRFSVSADDTKCNTNLGVLAHINPDKLEIDGLGNVKSREEARCIKLSEKQRIGELTLKWNPQATRSVDDLELLRELVPPTTLQGFTIYDYISVSFPDWLMSMSIGNYLPNVVRMEMFYLPNCKSLPPLTQLPNLRVLTLEYMESLEEWVTTNSSDEATVNELMYCKLEEVNIYHCPKLRIKPHLPRVASWSIQESDDVLISWGESVSHNGASSASSPVKVSTNLTVQTWFVPLHQWRLLLHLPAISVLRIQCCLDLTISPEISWALKSLKSLTLTISHQSKLSEWIGELTYLQQLRIDTYEKIEELPDNIRQLKQLQSLTLHSCGSLRQVPMWLGELTSLKKLVIFRCKAITTLPNSIQQLTNLQELEILSCPNLEQWCEAEENKMKLAHIGEKNIKFDSPSPPRIAAIPASRRSISLRWPLLRRKIRR